MAIKKVPPTLAYPKVAREEHAALKALSKGEATESQQVLALALIVKKFAQYQNLLYIAGSFDETAFISGRAYVATLVREYIDKPISATPKGESNELK